MEYKIIRSDRRTVAIAIKDCEVIVRAPRRMSEREINKFVLAHSNWIEEHLRRAALSKEKLADIDPMSPDEISELAARAAEYIPSRVAIYAERLGVDYGRISIRNQLTRWGSCSSKGDLNFNCLLMLAPPEVIDAIVAHELCHRKQMNHSKRFYGELYALFPNYDQAHSWLKEHGAELMKRNPKKK